MFMIKTSKFCNNSFSLGFTMLELLVVISIIGILIALGTVSFMTAQRKGRDAKRRGDMKSIQNAFEQYYGQNGTYADCEIMASEDFMPGGLPSDPKPTLSYEGTCDADGYCYCAELESSEGNSSDNNCTFTSGTATESAYFCVNNLQ